MVEVKTSTLPNARRGLFATRDYVVGDLVCYHHGYFKARPVSQEWDYAFGNGAKTVIGYIQPKSSLESAQIANDCTMPVLDKFPDADDFKTQLAYTLFSFYRAQDNRTHIRPLSGEAHGCKIPFYATTDIKKGQEIFYNYGIEYWLKRLFQMHNNANLCRVLVYIYHQLDRGPRPPSLAAPTDEHDYIRKRLQHVGNQFYCPDLQIIIAAKAAGYFPEYKTSEDPL